MSATDGSLGLVSEDLAGLPAHAATGGRLTWLSGENAGLAVEVKAHLSGGRLDLWQRSAFPIRAGDSFRTSAGCDKTLATCRDRFANTANFRGFPHMPGNDLVLRALGENDAGLDGSSLFG